MADMPCIYEMNMSNEKDLINEDILEGKAINILISLLSGPKTVKELEKDLKIPVMSIQLYLRRLLTINFIKISDTNISDNKIEYVYSLTSTNIEILNSIKKTANVELNKEISSEHFAKLTKEMIKNLYLFNDKPHKAKAYFIKANEESMIKFKKELDELFDKYKMLEDEKSTNIYGFISVFAPYEVLM